ncbi:hypothetical protein [Paenibacillus thiaminolyticus]|nr:hypothetical protein [Paenibacillus thiaminolyticus]
MKVEEQAAASFYREGSLVMVSFAVRDFPFGAALPLLFTDRNV